LQRCLKQPRHCWTDSRRYSTYTTENSRNIDGPFSCVMLHTSTAHVTEEVTDPTLRLFKCREKRRYFRRQWETAVSKRI
jgi:hypothetical protein